MLRPLPLGLLASLLMLGTTACESDGPSQQASARGNAGVATSVNRYLWTASLETLDFMPLFSVDPVAGVIITDWYANPQAPNERFKANVFILDTALRADALRVSVFRQMPIQLPDGSVTWQDQPVNPATAAEIENAILTRARELRLNSLEG